MALLIACILWVFAASLCAMLPMRAQMVPGLALMIAAPCLMVWAGLAVAWWLAAILLAAFVSMFRNPLRYFWARARGRNPEIPR